MQLDMQLDMREPSRMKLLFGTPILIILDATILNPYAKIVFTVDLFVPTEEAGLMGAIDVSFWGVELAFARIPGVLKTSVGYCGGRVENPTYEQVCSGSSGHTEAVHLAFDNNIVHLNELLDVFWEIHDPTTLNRQGNDIGTQYRSGIYYKSDAQLDIITRSIAKEQPRWNDPIVTEVKEEASNKYWVAEEYHQGYLARGGQCALKGDKTPIRCYG